jgi:hypothetical protein
VRRLRPEATPALVIDRRAPRQDRYWSHLTVPEPEWPAGPAPGADR